MRLWIGLYLPQLPLEVFCPNWSADKASVVLEQERVLTCSPAARAAGVRPGMRRGGVLMLMPEAQLFERTEAREADALHAVAMALLQYTPLVARAEESTLLIDIGASLRLFGGIRALCRRVLANMRALGFSASLSCAPTARGAWLLARHGGARVLGMESLGRRLDRLPSALPPPARPFSSWFEGIGCFSLGDMRRLPRPGLQRRCGRALLDLLDAAYGMTPEMFDWIEAPTTFRAHLELFDRVEHAEALLFGAHRLLLQMTGWLCARQLAVERIVLQLEHERGRVACPPTVIEIVLAEATWRDEHLVRLLKERLGKVALGAPVIGLCLEAPQVQPMAPPSESLFPEPGGSEDDQLRLFELLVARLGADNVLQAAPQADYRPELANIWVPVQQKIRAAAMLAQMPPDVLSLPRPSWLLAKPVALLMRNHRPFYGSPLKIVSAPERIEAGWWSEPQTRDYFIAEGQDHAHYWVYRERIVGAAEDAQPRWFLHGLFG
ncbi:Y-family DNA polymerase [Massilia glaciei]|uniref:DNA polymerase Y family protein n=1 Tax=Massilia glaciei TaxID=1524097 RepID=A0A2U2HFG1_9BURK|nr:DNA polymerase Y family protein [Massilia glaciei]PWF42901.1 DNA polymerase Y family protein [Massilia glaciei]